MIVGHGGRESALASRMAEHSELFAFAGHRNPSLVRYAHASGGEVQIGDVCDARAVAEFARAKRIDVAMVSADEPLAAGVVDALLAQGTRAVGPTRAGAEIEWNKAFARSLLAEVAPEATPRLRIVERAEDVHEAIASFDSAPVVVKPSGLTGGKGVKVMGPHLADHDEAADYARSLLGASRQRLGAHRGEDRRRRVHHPGDQRRAHRRVPQLHLRLPLSLRRRQRTGNRRHGLAVVRRADAAVHDRRALRAGVLDRRARDRAALARKAASSPAS